MGQFEILQHGFVFTDRQQLIYHLGRMIEKTGEIPEANEA